MKKVKVNKNGVKKIIAAVAVLLAVAVLGYEISNFNSSLKQRISSVGSDHTPASFSSRPVFP